MPLDDWAGRSVTLAIESEAASDTLCLIGSPELLGDEPTSRPPNLLFVSLDTLRSDQLGSYGAAHDLSPVLDALAAEGLRFTDSVSVSSFTLPTHTTMFSGQHPLEHGAISPAYPIDVERSPLLSQELRRRGYATAAFTGGGFMSPGFGFDHGFDVFDTRDPGGVPGFDAPLAEISPAHGGMAAMDPAFDWLERHRDQPFFLFLHTFFVHNYVPHPEYLAEVERHVECNPKLEELGYKRIREAGLAGNPAATAHFFHRYQATVRQVDEQFMGALLAQLERLGLAENTLLVVISDHGEQFMEHGKMGHGRYLWSELVRVPWILRGPGVPVGETRDGLARHLDVAPTLAGLLGLERDPRWTGRDLLAEPAAPESLLHVFGTVTSESLLTDDWKLIREVAGGGEEQQYLFSKPGDSEDAHDVADAHAEVTQPMARKLQALIEQAVERGGSRDASAPVDTALLETLKRLGYLGDEDG